MVKCKALTRSAVKGLKPVIMYWRINGHVIPMILPGAVNCGHPKSAQI